MAIIANYCSSPRELRVVGQYPHMIVENLDKPAVDLQNFLSAAALISQRAFAKRAQQWRMSGQNAHIPILAGQFRFGHLLIYQQPLGRSNFKLKRIRHLGYPFIFCAASSTSSIVPCM